MKYNYSFEDLPTEAIKKLRSIFFKSSYTDDRILFRIIGKTALASSLELRREMEAEGIDYLQRFGTMIRTQAYEAQRFGRKLTQEMIQGHIEMENNLDRYLKENVLGALSKNGQPLPGNSRSAMILNNLPAFKEYAQNYYYELGKSIHSLLVSERARRYESSNKSNEYEIASASLNLESLIREAVAKTADKFGDGTRLRKFYM